MILARAVVEKSIKNVTVLEIMKLETLLEFAEMLNAFRRVERVIYVNGTDRMENDSEHSYHLAMFAWYIVSSEKLSLDLDLILKYALVHDLVEVYAGDTYVFSRDKEHLDSKIGREREALVRLKKEFPLCNEIFSLVERYEKHDDRESRFVYALDKLQPVIQIYLDGGRIWKENNVTFQMFLERKKDKIALSPEIKPYFEELTVFFKEKEKKLFNDK
jgi:putative hydrolases of HD superfamily